MQYVRHATILPATISIPLSMHAPYVIVLPTCTLIQLTPLTHVGCVCCPTVLPAHLITSVGPAQLAMSVIQQEMVSATYAK
jgi:hypothetical protein